MSDTEPVPDLSNEVNVLQSRLNNLQSDRDELINAVRKLIQHLGTFTNGEIDAKNFRTRIGDIEERLKRL